MGSKNKLARRAKPTEIISHWPKLMENFQFSSQEFYAKLEAALAQRKIPDLRVERVDWKEGGPLSARREYLRVRRERLVFDVCGAPFGTGFFVSLWYGEKPLRFGFVAAFLLLLGLIAAFGLTVGFNTVGRTLWVLGVRTQPSELTMILGIAAVVATIGLIVIVGPNLDQRLRETPIIGYLYERYFRRITLYRIDLTCMYLAAVQSSVTQVIDEISKEKGIPPLSEFERTPLFRELLQVHGGNGHN